MKEHGQGPETWRKEEQLRKIFDTHAAICTKISQRYYGANARYLYVDANAGCGRNRKLDGAPDGSPLVILDVLAKYQRFFREIRAYFFEKDIGRREDLEMTIKKRGKTESWSKSFSNLTYSIHGDNSDMEVVVGKQRTTVGMVFFDTDGGCAINGVSHYYLETLKMVDLLFYISPTNIKRHCYSIMNRIDTKDCKHAVELADVPYRCWFKLRPYWLLREPSSSAWHWSFALGTTEKGKNLLEGNWKKEGFITAKESRCLLRREFPCPVPHVPGVSETPDLFEGESRTSGNGRRAVRAMPKASVNRTASSDLSAMGEV